jgi:predicted deacylase
MKIGTAIAAKGQLVTGHVELAQYPDTPIVSPVMIAQGLKPGPTLWIQCCVHGPEIGGPISVARFLREIDLSTMSGTIVGLMVANPLGFRQYNRLTPQDGANINRVFPGKTDGSISEQMAHRLLQLALEHGDMLLDLHSGGDLTITAHYVIYAKMDNAGSREAQRLAGCVGSRYQWGSDEPWMKGSALTNFTLMGNKPALIVETGGGARVTEQDFANYRASLQGLTRAMGMLSGDLPTVTDPRPGGNAVHLKAQVGGFWHPKVEPGEDMVRGQVMGTIINIFGEKVAEVTCPFEHAWVGSIRRPFMPIYSGDQMMEVVERA